MSNDIPNDLIVHQLFNLFSKNFGQSARVPDNFDQKIKMINDIKRNDYTGIINTVLEYMIKSGTVDFSFQCQDATLRKRITDWFKNINKGLSIDVQKGLKSVTSQYLRERWYSSFIGIRISWIKTDDYWMPKNIWLLDGSSIIVEGKTEILGGYQYKVGKDGTVFKNTEKETIIIRKPFNSWYDKYPDPYLAKKGALYSALMKRELLQKQGDVLEAILPYMLAIRAGNDALAKIDALPTEPDLTALVEQVKKIKSEFGTRVNSKGIVGGFAHDVTFEHLIPDLTKFFNESIIKPIDRNLFASLGLIELTGFSSNREEAILNPKMMVEEVKDGVSDWALILEDIVDAIKDKNGLDEKIIRVVPSTIKSFVTDNMRVLARSAYDRGLITKQTFDEDYLGLDFEVEIQRSDIENRRNLDERMKAPVILNQDSNTTPDTRNPNSVEPNNTPETNTSSPDVKATCTSCLSSFPITAIESKSISIECPECKELLLVIDAKKEENLQAPYENIDQLPKQCEVLPIAAKKMFMRVVNDAIKRGLSDSQAFKEAWGAIKKYYEKNSEGKWKKKKKAEIQLSECFHCKAQIDNELIAKIKDGVIECSECQEELKIIEGSIEVPQFGESDVIKITQKIKAEVEEVKQKKSIRTKQEKLLDKILGEE